jgi:hypothetical protein
VHLRQRHWWLCGDQMQQTAACFPECLPSKLVTPHVHLHMDPPIIWTACKSNCDVKHNCCHACAEPIVHQPHVNGRVMQAVEAGLTRALAMAALAARDVYPWSGPCTGHSLAGPSCMPSCMSHAPLLPALPQVVHHDNQVVVKDARNPVSRLADVLSLLDSAATAHVFWSLVRLRIGLWDVRCK